MEIINQVLYKPIEKGYDFSLTVSGPAGYLAAFDSINADFKKTKALNSPVIIGLELGDGIEKSGDTIVLTIPASVTAEITEDFLYMDIKAKIGANPPVKLLDCISKVLDFATPWQ